MNKKEKNNVKGLIFEREKEIKNSHHDEICMLLCDKFVIFNVFKKISRIEYENWGKDQCDKENFVMKKTNPVLINPDSFNDLPLERFIEEQIITNNHVEPSQQHYMNVVARTINRTNIIAEKPIGTKGYTKGFIDVYAVIESGRYYYSDKDAYCSLDCGSHVLAIEVKSEEPSFGEIVREINYYKSNHHFHTHVNWLLVAPSCSFIDKLKDQGILFLSFDEVRQIAQKKDS